MEIIPKKRDKEAKKLYQFLRWYFRSNKHRMESFHNEALKNYLLHGTALTHCKLESEVLL